MDTRLFVRTMSRMGRIVKGGHNIVIEKLSQTRYHISIDNTRYTNQSQDATVTLLDWKLKEFEALS